MNKHKLSQHFSNSDLRDIMIEAQKKIEEARSNTDLLSDRKAATYIMIAAVADIAVERYRNPKALNVSGTEINEADYYGEVEYPESMELLIKIQHTPKTPIPNRGANLLRIRIGYLARDTFKGIAISATPIKVSGNGWVRQTPMKTVWTPVSEVIGDFKLPGIIEDTYDKVASRSYQPAEELISKFLIDNGYSEML